MCCEMLRQLRREGADQSEIYGNEEMKGNAEMKPRAVLVDCDMDMPRNVRRYFPDLSIDPDTMICGKEDSANYAFRGHYTIGKEIVDICKEVIRQQLEQCDRP